MFTTSMKHWRCSRRATCSAAQRFNRHSSVIVSCSAHYTLGLVVHYTSSFVMFKYHKHVNLECLDFCRYITYKISKQLYIAHTHTLTVEQIISQVDTIYFYTFGLEKVIFYIVLKHLYICFILYLLVKKIHLLYKLVNHSKWYKKTFG